LILINCDHRWGFPCCVWSPMPTCHRHYPGRADGACSLVHLHRQRPSLCNSQVGSCNYCFGTCSAFTHVMACTLAGSPSDPFHRKLRQLRCLHCRFDCYRVERTSSRAGVAPAEVQRLSRRTVSPIMRTRCDPTNTGHEVRQSTERRLLRLDTKAAQNYQYRPKCRLARHERWGETQL
jgi:hypothetical protein